MSFENDSLKRVRTSSDDSPSVDAFSRNGSTQDILSIVATSYTGTSNVIAGICWKEIQ